MVKLRFISQLTEQSIIGPAINIPMDKLHLLNKSTEVDWIRTPEEAGGGAAGLLEVMHQLHCVVCVLEVDQLLPYRFG